MTLQAERLRRLRSLGLLFLALRLPALGQAPQLPLTVTQAQSAFVSNETGNPSVLAAAVDQFDKWHRFTLVQDREKADLVVVFSHKPGLDRFGNAGFTVMQVFVSHMPQPVFRTQKAGKLIWIKELPTRSCVDDFMRHLEEAQAPQTRPPAGSTGP